MADRGGAPAKKIIINIILPPATPVIFSAPVPNQPINTMKKITIFLFLLIALFGCSDNKAKTDEATGNPAFTIKPLVIGTGEEGGWGADIRLSITDIADGDSATTYTAISSFEGKNAGLAIVIPRAKEKDGFGEGIVLKSIGPESDYLLRALAKLYKQKADTALKFVDSVSANYVNLKEFAKSLGGQEGRNYSTENEYKLFFETSDDAGELYLNINSGEHWIELKEKDEGYRAVVIRALKK
jgi:hypothetical protein